MVFSGYHPFSLNIDKAGKFLEFYKSYEGLRKGARYDSYCK